MLQPKFHRRHIRTVLAIVVILGGLFLLLVFSPRQCCIRQACDRNGFVQLVCPGYWSSPSRYSESTYRRCTQIKNVIQWTCTSLLGPCDADNAVFCLRDFRAELQSAADTRALSADVERSNLAAWIEKRVQNPVDQQFISLSNQCGRLGNWMFQMASLIGIAKKINRIPVPFTIPIYYSHFSRLGMASLMDNDVVQNATLRNRVAVIEQNVKNFTGIYAKFLSDLSSSIVIHGCLQSYKFFIEVQHEIRLIFSYAFYNQTVSKIVTKIESGKWITKLQVVPLKVGIHVRTGDFLTNQSGLDGLTPPPADYYFRAVSLLEAQVSQPLVFFVVNDDYRYCKQVFKDKKFGIQRSQSPSQDLALLQLMDYVIISAGSFGWWGAFTSQARKVIYYKNWPVPNTTVWRALGIDRDEYYPPDWTGID